MLSQNDELEELMVVCLFLCFCGGLLYQSPFRPSTITSLITETPDDVLSGFVIDVTVGR